ncbi:MAG: acetoacetate decarboxylase family protein [Acidimicrobiales bacterium]|jgi:hypothetical protein|nr:acetoacetate decarboxylase family protein [Acidimicrobiales bacterium]
MLSGTATLADLLLGAATMPDLATAPAELGGVELLKVVTETRFAHRTATLPHGLHPTNPPTAILHVWKAETSPWGPFSMAEARVGCRSGTRPRGLVLGCVVDGPDAAVDALRARWGFPARPGRVALRRTYDGVTASVAVDRVEVCSVHAVDPDPIDGSDLAWTTTLTLAHTPRGPRLVQLEVEHRVERAERVRARVDRFDGDAWAHPALAPTHVVSAAVTVGTAVLPSLRFVARPEELAFTGTEPVQPPATGSATG